MCPRSPDTTPAAPADLEAERAVLGAILLDNAVAVPEAEMLTPEDFHGEAHRLVFGAMLLLEGRGEPLDPVTVGDALGRDLERAGGLGYLSTLMDGLPRALNVAQYAEIVKGKSSLRRLAQLGEDLREAALSGEDTSDLLETISVIGTGNGGPPEESILVEVKRQRIRREALRRINAAERSAAPPEALSTLGDLLARPRPAAPEWTIPRWQPAGSRVMLAAQFKAGKTVLTGNLCRSLVDGDDFLGVATMTPVDGTVALLDFEMSEAQLLTWLEGQGILNTHRVLVVPMRGRARAFDLLDAGVRAAWAALLAERGVRYLILDCLRPVLDALGLDENHEAGRFLVALDALLSEAQIPDCLVVHHMGHAGERSRGDSRLRDWPDVEWRLVRQGDDDAASPRFLAAYGRDVDQAEKQLSFDPRTRRLTLIGGTRAEARSREALDEILGALERAGEPLSGRAVEAALEGSCPRDRVREGLKFGVRKGFVVIEPGPRGAKLHRLADSPSIGDRAGVRDECAPRSESECARAHTLRAK